MRNWLIAHRGHLWTGAIVLACVCIWMAGMTYSRSYHACEVQRATEYAQPYKPSTGEKVATFLLCQGESLDANGELLTALGTLAIAAFTLTLWLVTGKTLALAREEFVATHRPRMFVQTVRMIDDGGMGADDKKAAIDFTLINGGETPAEIIEFSAYVYIQHEGVAFIPLETAAIPNRPSDLAIGPGQRVLVRANSKPIGLDWEMEIDDGEGTAFILGAVQYKGSDGINRITGFCRKYDAETDRWSAVNDPEREFAY